MSKTDVENAANASDADCTSEVAGTASEGKRTDAAGISGNDSNIFRNAFVWRHANAEAAGLSFPRAYSLALAPQIIYTKSRLLSQLVTSKAYQQVEFLAVGSFFVYSSTDAASGATLVRIPSSREDVFSAQSIPARSKRMLMKFLKFVIDYDTEEQKPVWQEKADKTLSEYLVEDSKLDNNLRDCILALTLNLDGNVTVKDGLATIHRHLTSIGLFGPGFCAVYPKWGGISEIAQVGCRAGAVGGGVYMLNTAVSMQKHDDDGMLSLELANKVSIRTPTLVSSQANRLPGSQAIARLVAIVNSPLQSLFEARAEGAPTPAVAVVNFPSGSLTDAPVYALVHSSETGECPLNQSKSVRFFFCIPLIVVL